MRILIIRHGDPDYVHDSLTEKGKREAALLAPRLAKENIDTVYVSPLGRAQATAAPTLAKIGKTAETLDWLREINAAFHVDGVTVSPWDIHPLCWCDNPHLHDKEHWADYAIYEKSGFFDTIQNIHTKFDALLAQHGFVHDGQIFRIRPGFENSNETIAFFCHMGLGNVLLSHLAGVATPVWWHNIFLAPTSVTTVFMERHRMDLPVALAHFFAIGDTSHLYAGGEPVSVSGLKNCISPIAPPRV